jgi:hypothetical protein
LASECVRRNATSCCKFSALSTVNLFANSCLKTTLLLLPPSVEPLGSAVSLMAARTTTVARYTRTLFSDRIHCIINQSMPPHVDVAKSSLPIKLFLCEWSGWASPFFCQKMFRIISHEMAFLHQRVKTLKKKNIKKNGH